jgi:type VI secretion system lysozyme-like protein
VTVAAPRSAPVAPALLFDRLADDDLAAPSEPVPLRTLNGEALRQSVLRELTDLLNTRCPFPPAQLQGRGRTALEYGLPDVSPAQPGSPDGRADVAARMQAAIAAYEPRLRQPQVVVEPDPLRPMEMLAYVQALLDAGSAPPVPVQFTVPVGTQARRTP